MFEYLPVRRPVTVFGRLFQYLVLAFLLANPAKGGQAALPTADASAAGNCAADSVDGNGLDAFVAWAETEIIPLGTVEPGADAVDLSALKPVVGAASRVVMIGEPAHGAREPLAFRNRFFRFLVRELGFTAIAIESGLSESRRVQEFIAGGSGDLQQTVRESLTWGFGEYDENVELIRWMRAYNAEPKHDVKLALYGIDLSGGHMGGMTRARIALDDALSFLARAAPNTSRPVQGRIKPYLDDFTGEKFAALTPHEQDGLGAAIDELIALLEREREALIASTSVEDYDWARRNAAVAKQLEQMFRVWPLADPGEGLDPDFYKPANVRDAAMAGNVLWALEREGPRGRVLLFAHNAHIMNAPLRGGPWSIYREPPTTMGQHLRAALSDSLLIVGTSSAANGPGLPATPDRPASLDRALDRIGVPAFLLDLRAAHACPEALAWLAASQTMRANFTTEIELEPYTGFDALLYVDRLTPAVDAATPP